MKKFFLSLCVLLGTMSACSDQPKETSIRSVMLTQPEPLGIEQTKLFSGVIQEAKTISLGFKTPGQIMRILVKEGDAVRQGQLIATLDDKDYKLGVEALEIQYKQLSNEVARMKKLFEGKSISGNDYEKAVAGLEQVRVQLQTNQNKLDYTRLYAPVSGYVQSVNFEVAEMVDAGRAIIDLLDVKQLEVEVDLPSNLYVQKDRFGGYFCRSAYGDGQDLPMKLISITPKADGNQLYRMRLAFDGPTAPKLTPGMNVEVGIRTLGDEGTPRFSVPLHAVCHAEGKDYVWVLTDDSKVTKREVELDRTTQAQGAVVLSGLTGNERLVKAGVDYLHENESVMVIEKPAETNVGGLL